MAIANFLGNLATQVRGLVASGRAVHVTEDTARELDLLAGLPWDAAPLPMLSERVLRHHPREVEVTARKLQPCEFAHGWLLASRAYSECCPSDETWERLQWTQRAAECAELAVLAVRLMPEAVGINPYNGTREGARAAWGFVIDAPFSIEDAVPLMRAWNIRAAAMAEFAQGVGSKYRRELEAM